MKHECKSLSWNHNGHQRGESAAKVYSDYRQPFLSGIQGAVSKELLIRDEDVQVLHGFDSVEHARAYLESELFQKDVFVGLKPLWSADPEVKIYLAV